MNAKRTKHAKQTKLNEIEEYLSIEGTGKEQVETELNELKENVDRTDIPVCVLSHNYSPKRSKFLVSLLEEHTKIGLDRDYYIFAYADQENLYRIFHNIERIKVMYIPVELEIYSTLAGKRQYILEYLQNNGFKHGFFIEDDTFSFRLPIGSTTKSGKFRNKAFIMSNALTFSLWEHLIEKHHLTYSGALNNMEFSFKDLRLKPFIKYLAQTVQAVHIDVENCKKNNINFDTHSGWDDYDMIIQQCVYSVGTQGIVISYDTPSLKSGTSTISNSLQALEERCARNTTALVKKWGLGLVREDIRKGLYNAKVNWHNIRRGKTKNVHLKEIIHKDNKESKIIIDTLAENK